MSKLIGFCPMKKTEGVVCFLTEEGRGNVQGDSSRNEYLYGDIAKKINASVIGKDVDFIYSRGYNGRAIVSDVIIK